ncbi:MAG: hypothetical protein ABFR89_10230 [Actinomycetota bacterium]
MADSRKTRGLVMMIVGLVMVLVSVAIVFAAEEPMPVGLGVIGIAFIAVGARYRRD